MLFLKSYKKNQTLNVVLRIFLAYFKSGEEMYGSFVTSVNNVSSAQRNN
jgi:hypothetical protein